MRQHHLEIVRRDCFKRHAAGTLPDYLEEMCWDVAYREATKFREFWDVEIVAKVTDLKNRLISAAQILDMGFGKVVLKDGTVIDATHPSAPGQVFH